MGGFDRVSELVGETRRGRESRRGAEKREVALLAKCFVKVNLIRVGQTSSRSESVCHAHRRQLNAPRVEILELKGDVFSKNLPNSRPHLFNY